MFPQTNKKNCFLIFQVMEISSPRLKKLLYFFQKRKKILTFLGIKKMKKFLIIFQKQFPAQKIKDHSQKNLLYFPKKVFLIFRRMEPFTSKLKYFLIFFLFFLKIVFYIIFFIRIYSSEEIFLTWLYFSKNTWPYYRYINTLRAFFGVDFSFMTFCLSFSIFFLCTGSLLFYFYLFIFFNASVDFFPILFIFHQKRHTFSFIKISSIYTHFFSMCTQGISIKSNFLASF